MTTPNAESAGRRWSTCERCGDLIYAKTFGRSEGMWLHTSIRTHAARPQAAHSQSAIRRDEAEA